MTLKQEIVEDEIETLLNDPKYSDPINCEFVIKIVLLLLKFEMLAFETFPNVQLFKMKVL